MDSSNTTNTVPAEEERAQLPATYFYPDTWKPEVPNESPLPYELAKFHWCAGLDANKRNNVFFLSKTDIIFGLGSTYHILNIETLERRIFFSKDGKGIGAIAVHPNKQWFAIGEKGTWPNVYIYDYPDLRLYRILRKGTEKAYSAMAWSPSGTKLATVGSEPDYMLTVWDWINERVILKCKAFGQEVYSVSFSPAYEEQIITSGTAHIRFWKMAKTFTGLKLQGDLGKFGQVELSDIAGYAELPDGKVLSGSEYGNLLLWEGALIKAVLTLKDGSPCHGGAVETVLLLKDTFLTAGTDGYLKWWDLNQVDLAEPEEGFEVPIECTKQVLIGDHAEILSLVMGEECWIALDKKGKLWRISDDYLDHKVILDFHAGPVNDLIVSPDHNVAISIGQDSKTRLWDFVSQKEVYSNSWIGSGTCLAWWPQSRYNNGKIVIAGFDNGIIRLLYLGPKSFELLGAWKAHDTAVLKAEYSKDGKKLITAASDNTFFFFDVMEDGNLEPVCLSRVDSKITDMVWHPESNRVLISLESGSVVEVNSPNRDSLNTSASYEVDLPQRRWTIKMMEFQKKKDDEEVDFFRMPRREEKQETPEWPPAAINCCVYNPANNHQFVLSVEKPYNNFLYICSFDKDRPISAIPTSEPAAISFSTSKNFLISAHKDGSFEIRPFGSMDKYLKYRPHDGYTHITTAQLTYNENYAVSAAADGTLFITELYPAYIIETAATGRMPQTQAEGKFELGVSTLGIENRPDRIKTLSDDITDPSIYSIQMDKLKTDEDKKRAIAEMKKEKKRQEIAALRAEFEALRRENEATDPKYKLTEEELRVDPEYYETLVRRNKELEEEVEKEVAWGKAFHQLALDKYRKYFLENVAVERFSVHSLKGPENVTSFRVTHPSEFLTTNLEMIQNAIEEEKMRHGSVISETESIMSPGRFSQHTADHHSEMHEETKAEFKLTVQAQTSSKTDKKKTRAQEMMEERTRDREARKVRMDNLKKQKPPEDVIDPVDQREIDIAMATMGDFKLKTSPDYVVPENQTVNAAKKRRQMFLLMESAHNLKMDLNSRLLALRENKVRLIDWIKRHNSRIHEINAELGVEEELFEPSFKDDEWPENSYLITDEDIEMFERVKKEREKNKSFNPYGADKKVEEQKQVSEDKPRVRDTRRHTTKLNSDSEKGFKAHKELKLMNEKRALQSDISKRVEQFDEALKQQLEQKYLLESDLKQIDMKLITFYQELLLLNDKEPEDRELSNKMNKLREDKAVLMAEIAEITRQYETQKQDSEEITKKQNEIYEKFNNKVDENNPHYEFLLSVLDKKVKRRKQKKKKDSEAESEEGAEEDEDEEEEEEESDLSDDSDDESEQNEDLCPNDCDMNLFDEIIQLREERLDLADMAAEKTQIMLDLKKKTEDIEKKERVINQAIARTDQEIQEFQREKMKQLNQIIVALMLAQDQLQTIEGNSLPDTLDHSVLFTHAELEKLKNRIFELKDEKEDCKNRKKKLMKDQRDEEKNIKLLTKEKEEAQKKFEAIQALKFGQKIKLDNLKYAESSEHLAKLKTDFSKVERDAINRIEESKSKLANTREMLNKVTERNTTLIKKRTAILSKILEFNNKLDLGNQDMFKEEDESEKDFDKQERERLKNLLELQRREIETLKTEINLFRRKGGHIYTKMSANKRANIG